VLGNMLAARLHATKKVSLDNIPIPSIGSTDVLVKVQAMGVCHSDLHIVNGMMIPPKYPATLGHEGAGVVERVGERVTNVKVGDPVALYYMSICGQCYYCMTGKENLCDNLLNLGLELEGTWAEYVALPAQSAIKLPGGVPFDQAALAGCAVVTPFHAMTVGEVRPGDAVAIYGTGGVGIHGVQLARFFGASQIIAVDINQMKLEAAKHVGATDLVNAKLEDPVVAVKRLTGGRGVDAAFEFIGLRLTQEQIVKSVKKGGRAVMVGISGVKFEIDANDFLFSGAQLRTTQNHTRDHLIRILDLISRGRIDVAGSISRRYPLSEANKALEALDKQTDNPIRITLYT
jgi:propanol-preferring alcohol dehydrogenase